MSSLPNYKARLERANRNQVPVRSAIDSFRRFKWFTTFLVILFPIYPSLAAIGVDNRVQVGDYDESSIITSFIDTEDLDYISESGLVTIKSESEDFSESENVLPVLTPKAEIPESNVRHYTVVEYDDIIKISKKYNISAEVILWSNGLTMNDTLVVGQKLIIPPVSGIVHILKTHETVSDIAKQYNVSVDEILKVNNISDARKIPDGTKLMIPGWVRSEIVEVKVEPKKEENIDKKKEQKGESKKVEVKKESPQISKPKKAEKKSEPEKVPAVESSTKVNDNGLKDRYQIKFTGLGRGFVGGNCTWHVARNKNVTWRGNANQWIKNARAKGVPTGKTPVVGAIVQFSGHGYNSYYGHVGIVTDIQGDNIIVSDMNYTGLYKVTIRKVPKNHPAIDGYIYVD